MFLTLARQANSANIRPLEGSGTTVLTIADNPYQVFNLSASRNVVLPSTGVLAGDIYIIENRSAFDLVVQSFNGAALTLANLANIDATHQTGYAVLKPLVAAPQTPTDWRVLEVYDEYKFVPTFTGSGLSLTSNAKLTRINNKVILSLSSNTGTANNSSPNLQTGSGTMPVRFRPNRPYLLISALPNGGTPTASYILTATDGNIIFKGSLTGANFSGGTSGFYDTTSTWDIY